MPVLRRIFAAMFISVLELFKIGIGPSSSHTMGPMVAAATFRSQVEEYLLLSEWPSDENARLRLSCELFGSLAWTGHGHATDRAVTLGFHGYAPDELVHEDVAALSERLSGLQAISLDRCSAAFSPSTDIEFNRGPGLDEHPNGMVFRLSGSPSAGADDELLLTQTYFSIGGGFICRLEDMADIEAPLGMHIWDHYPHPFNSALSMLEMSRKHSVSIPEMKRENELADIPNDALNEGLDNIWAAMQTCMDRGLQTDGVLPGGLGVRRRAQSLKKAFESSERNVTMADWLCAYAMAVNEENAAGHMVVTAPTNGAAGVIPAVLRYAVDHEGATTNDIRDYLLTAAAIGGLIKHNSSISGAEVGCQGEIGSAAAMAAAGLCAIRGGSTLQIENAAEIALEHHLGMTCDPVAGLVQVPCIERNGFGAIKAYTAASLAMHGSGEHFMPLDRCIEAMKQTGIEMSHKYKETSLGGLAVSITEC